jgi:hypothetical protein
MSVGASICLAAVLLCASAATADPSRYVLLNLTPGSDRAPALAKMRADAPTGGDVAVGFAVIVSYLNQPLARAEAELRACLHQAESNNLPLVVQLDGEQWWDGRPDLWNWWDPGKPGYDPANRQTVEWTGWGPEYAVRIAWRNWGRQIRVLPPPNLMAPRYRAACHEAMARLVPVILDWWHGLPPERRWLFAGLKLGWESSIGVNAFHYPGGNALADRPEAEDPKGGIDPDVLPARGVAGLGYAAVTTAGIATSGEMREEWLTEVVRRHLEDLCRQAAELGVPRDHLFTHCGGWHQGETLYGAALNRWSCPGWSFYRYAADPAADKSAMAAWSGSDAPYWGAVEWLAGGGREQWRQALRTVLALPRLRYVGVFNWSDMEKYPVQWAGLLDAVRAPN